MGDWESEIRQIADLTGEVSRLEQQLEAADELAQALAEAVLDIDGSFGGPDHVFLRRDMWARVVALAKELKSCSLS